MIQNNIKSGLSFCLAAGLFGVAVGCNSASSSPASGGSAGSAAGATAAAASPTSPAPTTSAPTATSPTAAAPPPTTATSGAPTTPAAPATVGPPCHSSDPTASCLALKYVVFTDASNSETPVATQADAIANLVTINQIWKQCNIQFQIDDFMSVDPVKYNLPYSTSTDQGLDDVRTAFVDTKTLLVATTGVWSGTLGSESANAWTQMPGGGVMGSIMEGSIATFAPIYAHELGHYLNLVHVADQTALMNPVIYSTSTVLYQSQCATAQAAVQSDYQSMLR